MFLNVQMHVFAVFAGIHSEDSRTQHENTLKARYTQCIHNLSVGDVATLRGRSKQPGRSKAKKDEARLLRYNSIQSLPSVGTDYSVFMPSSSEVDCTLRPQSRNYAVYATPVQTEPPENGSEIDTPPPLPPPPFDFQFGSSGPEVIPIVTKQNHTYANVSEALQAESSDAVESSFRPGECACLSSVGTDVTDAAVADPGRGSGEVKHRSSSSMHPAALSSGKSLSLLCLPASASSPSSSRVARLPPPPPLLLSVDGKNLPPVPRRAPKQAGGPGACSQNGTKNSEVDRKASRADTVVQKSVDKADMDVMTHDRARQHEPPHRVLQSANQTGRGNHAMVAPLKITREQPQVARITKRSFSVDATAQESVAVTSADADSTASEDGDCGFLLLAERARQEYIKRRASVGGAEHLLRSSATEPQLTTQPPITARRHSPNVGECSITQKAGEQQQWYKVSAVNGESHHRTEAVQAANATNHGKVRHSISNEQSLIPPSCNGRMVDHNQYSAETSSENHVHQRTAVSASVPPSGKTSISSAYEASELDGIFVLPPPPDFAEWNGKSPPGAELTSSSPLALDLVLPPPPPEFNDSPNRVGSDFRSRPVVTWSVTDVAQWLDGLQMGCHCNSFVAHSIDGRRLVELGRSELIALGVSQVGQRMNLERAIKRAVIYVPNHS